MIQQKYNDFINDISPFVYYKDEISRVIFITLLIKWSILIEDLPWAWKTTLSKAIAKLFWYDFNRMHATSDLMPQDIVWWEYFNIKTKEIEIKKWPIFTQLFLCDEINRMNPKSQSAFLQAMEEKKISIMWVDYNLDDNFCVIATQNPIEFDWTFTLPEAQKDRFYSKISLWIPDDKIQKEIFTWDFYSKINTIQNNLKQVINKQEVNTFLEQIKNIKVSSEFANWLVKFRNNIFESSNILHPLSQRWLSIFLLAIKANAFLQGREYVVPQDWVDLVESFLWHRLDINNNNTNQLVEIYKKSF